MNYECINACALVVRAYACVQICARVCIRTSAFLKGVYIPLKAGFIQKSIPNLLFQPQFRKSLEHVSKFICGAVIFNIRMPRCQVFMAIA